MAAHTYTHTAHIPLSHTTHPQHTFSRIQIHTQLNNYAQYSTVLYSIIQYIDRIKYAPHTAFRVINYTQHNVNPSTTPLTPPSPPSKGWIVPGQLVQELSFEDTSVGDIAPNRIMVKVYTVNNFQNIPKKG